LGAPPVWDEMGAWARGHGQAGLEKKSVGWGSRAFFNDPEGEKVQPWLKRVAGWKKAAGLLPIPLYRTHPKSSRRMEDDRGSWGWESRRLSGCELLGRPPPRGGGGRETFGLKKTLLVSTTPGEGRGIQAPPTDSKGRCSFYRKKVGGIEGVGTSGPSSVFVNLPALPGDGQARDYGLALQQMKIRDTVRRAHTPSLLAF